MRIPTKTHGIAFLGVWTLFDWTQRPWENRMECTKVYVWGKSPNLRYTKCDDLSKLSNDEVYQLRIQVLGLVWYPSPLECQDMKTPYLALQCDIQHAKTNLGLRSFFVENNDAQFAKCETSWAYLMPITLLHMLNRPDTLFLDKIYLLNYCWPCNSLLKPNHGFRSLFHVTSTLFGGSSLSAFGLWPFAHD